MPHIQKQITVFSPLCSPQIMGLDELEIRELSDTVGQVYASLLSAHARLLQAMMPLVHWKNVKLIMIFEQNTYLNPLEDVKALVKSELGGSGLQLEFYQKYSRTNRKPMLGKHVCRKVKLDMVLTCLDYIRKDKLLYCDTVMSLGWAVLAEATSKVSNLVTALGGTSSGSNGLSSACMDVHMYRNSSRGLNTPDRLVGNLMKAPGQLTLVNKKLTDAQHVQHGKELLAKLREQMLLVTVQESDKSGCGKVQTGGKKSVGGEYTRDDVLSALLLLCHSSDEIKDWTKNSNIRLVI